jgi:hypothetical protein
MKKLLCCFGGLLVATASVHASPLFADNFTYPNGPLLGQGGWTITGASVVNPIQVASGAVALTTTGQDAYSALPGGLTTINDGTSLYVGLSLNVSAAQTAGDYFLHYSTTVGNTSIFPDRLFVKSDGAGGYLLGWSGSSSGVTYGTTPLTLGTPYRVVVAYNAVAGTANDTAAIYVNPTDLVNVVGNTAYNTWAWTGGTEVSPNVIAEINFRQGTATSAPTLTVDDLDVSQTFSDAAVWTPIPEPSSLSLLGGFGLLAWQIIRRRK